MLALTHSVTDHLAECELTFRQREPIDVDRARRQHSAYCDLLVDLGIEVVTVTASSDHPDAVFVEDVAVVLDEVAIAMTMGTASRRAEVDAFLPVLSRFRAVERLQPPARIEGGDVLRVGRTLFVGRSSRTDDAGIEALAEIGAPLGYVVVPVDVSGCLHLKTAVTAIGPGRLLLNRQWVDAKRFAGCEVLQVPTDEPDGANTLLVGDVVCVPASKPATARLLTNAGITVRAIDIGEFEKAEAGLTCLSLLLDPS